MHASNLGVDGSVKAKRRASAVGDLACHHCRRLAGWAFASCAPRRRCLHLRCGCFLLSCRASSIAAPDFLVARVSPLVPALFPSQGRRLLKCAHAKDSCGSTRDGLIADITARWIHQQTLTTECLPGSSGLCLLFFQYVPCSYFHRMMATQPTYTITIYFYFSLKIFI